MTTSGPSQAPLFEDGSEKPKRQNPHFPTPVVMDALRGGKNIRTGHNMEDGGRHNVSLSNLIEHRLDLTSSPAAIPASHSHSPGSDWARRMTAISGRQLRRWWPTSSLAGVFSRMCTATSAWASTRCYLTWKRSATPAGRSLFLLRPSAPPTGATGFGFLPTAMSSDWKGPNLSGSGSASSRGLATIVDPRHMWPTLRHEGFDAGAHRGTPDSLHAAVKLMPTPTARDWKDGASVQNVPENGLLGRWSVNHSTTPGPGQKLSAAWVTRLMGYPDGHLDLNEDWIEIA